LSVLVPLSKYVVYEDISYKGQPLPVDWQLHPITLKTSQKFN